MNFSAALNETLIHFGISAKDLAESSEVRQATISEFRNEKREVHTDVLERILKALPLEAQKYLFLKIFIGQVEQDLLLEMFIDQLDQDAFLQTLVEHLDQEGFATLLNIAASRIRQPKNIQKSRSELSFSR